jgi:predicted neuraminidase
MKIPSVFTWLGMAAVLGLHFLPARTQSRPAPPRFQVAPVMTAPTNSPPSHRVEDLGGGVASVHVASLCEPAPGQLAAAWYGGSREGAKDVAVFFSRRDSRGWSAAVPVVTAETARQELGHYVRKVGNAVLFADAQGKLSLLYVAIAIGGWSGSSLALKESTDLGQTWTPSRRLILSPFFNISTLVKNGATPLENGGWAVPIYQELFGKFPEILWLQERAGTPTAVRTRVFGGRTAFQPALVALDAQNALMLCRTASEQRDLFATRSADGGQTWSTPQPTGLPNSDSGVDAIRLRDGRLLLAFNDTNSGRANLRLAISPNGGTTWQRGPYLEQEPETEFSYPFLFQAKNGEIHLAYTWKRRAIRVVSFNSTWLDAQLPK